MRIVSSRPGPLQVVLLLPFGCRILASFPDDGSVRDITAGCPDLLLNLLLQPPDTGPAGSVSADLVTAATVDLSEGSWGQVVMLLEEVPEGRSEQVPSDRVPQLLSAALALAIAEAVAAPPRPSAPPR